MGDTMLARWLQALCLVLGPLGAVLVEVVTPTGDGNAATSVAQAAAHHGAMRLTLVGDGLGLLLAPAVLIVAGIARPAAPRIAEVAGTVAFVGYSCLLSVISVDALLDVAASQPNRAAAVSMVDEFTSNGLITATLAVYLIGSLLGLILLGIALWRSGVVPRWAALAVAVEPAFEIADHAVGIGSLAGAAGYLLVTGAFAVCALRVVSPTRRPAAG
jgi:hypothetical protein